MSISDLTVYPNISAALRDFQCLCGFFLDHKQRKEVVALIEKNGLSRNYVNRLICDVMDYRSVSVPVFRPVLVAAPCMPRFDGRGIA